MKKGLAIVLSVMLLFGSVTGLAQEKPVKRAPVQTPLEVTVTDVGVQIYGFFMASEPVDGGTLRTVGYAGGLQASWVDGVEPISEDAVTLIREFLQSPKGIQFVENMKGGASLRTQTEYGDFDVDAVVNEDLSGEPVVEISLDGDPLPQVGPPPIPPFADCYEGARCFWCAVEGIGWSIAVGVACAGAITPIQIAACAAAVATWAEWVSRCRGTCNRRNYPC